MPVSASSGAWWSTGYWAVLRRYKTMIAATALILMAVTEAVTLAQHPIYQATAEVVVVPSTSGALDSLAARASPQPIDPVRFLNSEIELLTGPLVRSMVNRRIGSSTTISASGESNANIIRIQARSDHPDRAATIANTYAIVYLSLRTANATADIDNTIRPLRSEIASLQTRIDQTTGQQRADLIKSQAAFEKELSQLQVAVALNNAETRLLAPALQPASPIHRRPIARLLWALGIGISLGAAGAFYRDYRDDSIRSRDELIGAAAGSRHDGGMLPVYGVIPLVADGAVFGEAFQTLCTILRSKGLETGGVVIQVTSPTGGEGKTTTVVHLASALAAGGRRVAIVGCDLRRPQLHVRLGVGNEVGLTSVITGQARLMDALHVLDSQPGLVALTAGPIPPNPTDLLSRTRTQQILRSLQRQVDVVLLDCPPVMSMADSVVVAGYADVTIVVCRAGVTTRRQLGAALDVLRVGGSAAGALVLNGATSPDVESVAPRRGPTNRTRPAVGARPGP